ncbi:MAG: hypothetical protein GY805_24240 [Chloroflexi bacterium]|nr:hypothetical protein [Chloroflexota bacterium]
MNSIVLIFLFLDVITTVFVVAAAVLSSRISQSENIEERPLPTPEEVE